MKSPWTDIHLLKQIAEDNHAAFKILYERYWQELLDAAYKRLKDPQIAEDIVQEVYAHLYKARKTLVVSTSLSGYLHTVLKYKVLDEVRRQLVRERYREEWFRDRPNLSTSETSQLLEEKEMQALLEEAGSHMPPKCREVFFLRQREQLSYKEIAQRLNLSEKTVEGHLHRARVILKHYFKNYPINFILLIACILQ